MFKYVPPGTIKQGYLTKSPPLEKRGLKKWKKRWCIFSRANGEEPCLNYYHTEDDVFIGLPIKRVNLKHCFKVDVGLAHSSHKNIFAVHMPGRVYYFSAPSQIEMTEWVDTLCSHLNLMSSLVREEPFPLSHTIPKTKIRSSTLPSESHSRVATLPSETYYNHSQAGYLPPETYSSHTHVAAESYYSSSPNRPLPKPPDSPLPPLPDEMSNPSSPSRSPIPSPRLSSRSPHLPNMSLLPNSSSSSPRVPSHAHLSPTHTTPVPPLPYHSTHLPPSPTHPPIPSHSSPLSSRPSPHPSPLPSHSSPLLPSHIAPPPILHPRPRSPSDGNTSSAQSSRGSISLRPPAPPPKVADDTGSTGSRDSFGDLEDAPPTPPPRPHDKEVFSPTSESTSSSDSELEPPPPLPPRPT